MGNAADFGDARQLEDTGIELAILCHGWTGFPHSAQVGAIAIGLSLDNPDWLVRGLARCFADVYDIKILAVCDQSGGLNHAAYLICCTYAEKQNISFDEALIWLQSIIPDAQPDDALINKGQDIWP